MTTLNSYYYTFVNEEEADQEGGFIIIEDVTRYDDGFIEMGIEENQHPLLISILHPLDIRQEQENYFSNYDNLSESEFLNHFKDSGVKLIRNDDLW